MNKDFVLNQLQLKINLFAGVKIETPNYYTIECKGLIEEAIQKQYWREAFSIINERTGVSVAHMAAAASMIPKEFSVEEWSRQDHYGYTVAHIYALCGGDFSSLYQKKEIEIYQEIMNFRDAEDETVESYITNRGSHFPFAGFNFRNKFTICFLLVGEKSCQSYLQK